LRSKEDHPDEKKSKNWVAATNPRLPVLTGGQKSPKKENFQRRVAEKSVLKASLKC